MNCSLCLGASAARVRRRRPELLPVPAREPAWRREPKQRGYFCQRALPLCKIPRRKFAAHGIDDAAEGLAFLAQPAVNRPAIDAQHLCHALDATLPGSQLHHDQLSNLRRQQLRSRRLLALEQLPCLARHRRIGVRIRYGQV